MKALNIAAIIAALILPNVSFGADQILVEAKAIRVGTNGKEEFVASPRAVVFDGTRATLSVTRAGKVPDSVGGSDEAFQTGSILEVTPTIADGVIRFRTHLTVREASEEHTTEAVRSMAVTTHELFSSGSVKAGTAVSLKTTNAISGVLTWTIKLSKFPG